MSESGPKVHEAKRQPAEPATEAQPAQTVADAAPTSTSAVATLLARGAVGVDGQTERLHPTSVISLQRVLGNQWVARSLGNADPRLAAQTDPDSPPVQRMPVQRQDGNLDAGVGGGIRDAASPAGVPMPAPAPPLPTFDVDLVLSPGDRFDAAYEPRGPAPDVGTLTITLNVHITYQNFTRRMMRQEPFRSHRFTRAQRADFNWTDAERQAFARGFISSVQTAWSKQHTLRLNDLSFAEHRARVVVEVTEAPDLAAAHTRITAQKVPAGAPRLRSFVQDDEATLDIRDPSASETNADHSLDYVRQVGPFDLGSAAITPPLAAQITDIEADLRRFVPLQPSGEPHPDWVVFHTGRASSPGSRALNRRLSQERARAVEVRICADLGWSDQHQARPAGEEHATADPHFQRVDVQAINMGRTFGDVTQNVAAHEAGHMFGLDDEYVEEEVDPGEQPRLVGDRPEHYGDVEALLGADAANDLLVQDSGSIMSSGGEVRAGHYVYFVEAINKMTGKRWTVE